MLEPLNVSYSQVEKSIKLLARLTQLVLTVIIGSFACITLLLLFTTKAQSVQAAPPARPLADIITGTIVITHTENTTHTMRVFGNGRITDQFCSDNITRTNQINTDNITGTTIAVMFDQHNGDNVDVGWQGEFTPTTPITLTYDPSNIPGYSEDSYVVYASGVLSYQITQRTLATDTNNCVIMELVISNTGSVTPLTGGKLLYMVDIDVANRPVDDRGVYDSARRLVYLKDESGGDEGYAMGVSLLEGDLRGYGISTDYPNSDSAIRNEMITPTNAITDGSNNIVWLVADIPDLDPGQAAPFAFGLCAGTGSTADDAADNIVDSFDKVANLSVSKTATPTAGSSVVAGEPITYSVAISNTGYRYVNNIVVTDTVPASTDLIAYSVSQGSITASNRLITATIGRLDPTSGTVTVTLVVAPSITSTNGAVISNQAFIKSEPIITNTDIITHQIINAPVLTVTKRADPEPVASAGEVLTYTIVISCGGQGYATGVLVSDTLPANTEFVTGSIALDPSGAGTAGTEPPILASDVVITAGKSVTVTFAVTVSKSLTDGTVITNTATISSSYGVETSDPVTVTITTSADLTVTKSDSPDPVVAGTTLTYTLVYTNDGPSDARNVTITDTLPVSVTYGGGVSVTPPLFGPTITLPYLTWYTPTLAAEVSGTIVFTVTVDADASGTLANSVVITSTTSDPNPDDNDDDEQTAIATADLAVSKTVDDPVPNEGDTIVYTITVSNGGPDDATGVVLTDTLPTGVTYAAYSTSQGGYDSGSGRWTVGGLSNGSVATLTLMATVDTGTAGQTITNTTDGLSADQADPNTGNNADSATITVQSADLGVSKGVDNSTPNEGDTIVYTITVSNGGPDDVTGVVLTDTLPTGVTYAAHSISQGGYNSGSGRWTVGGLSSGSVATLTLTATVDTGTAGQTITNTTDGLSADQADPVAGNNQDSAYITVEHNPTLNIVKDGPAAANVGDTVVFTFTVSHDTVLGDRSPITNVSVTDDRAGSATYVSGDDGDDELEWGESWIYTASYTIQPTDDNPLVNTGTVQGKDQEGDNVTATASHTTTLNGFAPALNIFKEGPTTAKVGDTVVFTFTVTNVAFTPTFINANANGDGSPIGNVTVTDDFAGVASYIRGDDGDGLLKIGEVWVYTASYTIQATDPNPLVNTGMARGEDRDGDPVSDTDTHSTTIGGRTNFIFLPIVLRDY